MIRNCIFSVLLGSGLAVANSSTEVLVKFKQGQKAAFYANSFSALSLSDEFSTSQGDWAVVNTRSTKAALDELANNAHIEYAEPNYRYHAIGEKVSSYAPSDDMYEQLWGLKNTGDNEPASSRGTQSAPIGIAGVDIKAEAAWGIATGDPNLVIAVIDTGVDYTHQDLQGNIWVNEVERNGTPGVDDDGNGYTDDIYGYDFADSDSDPIDTQGHGTHCSGTIAAAHDGAGVAGVMKDAKIMAVKFLGENGGSLSDAVKAIDYAVKNGARIISASWGGRGASRALKEAIERARDAGVIFIAAAGNSRSDNDLIPHYPSNFEVENIISVASHTYNDELSTFSCYGLNTVHVAAPGQNILSTLPGDNYGVYSGTSMATPHVSGVVGLLLSHKGPLEPKEVRRMVMETASYGVSYDGKVNSNGRIDAFKLLSTK